MLIYRRSCGGGDVEVEEGWCRREWDVCDEGALDVVVTVDVDCGLCGRWLRCSVRVVAGACGVCNDV